ncbi:MAG: lysylphosphatidylglycerol synthase domain-containing protein [Betaproteobacteria bacterium]
MSPGAQRTWYWVKRVAPWAIAALVLTLIAHQAHTMDWPAVWKALRTQSPTRLAAAAAMALASYCLYASFDLIGRHLTGHRLSAVRTVSTAAISYAFNLNFGALVGGVALRLRLYARLGLDTPTVLQIVAHSMMTNWIGYLWVAGAVLTWAPPPLPDSWVLADSGLRAIGVAMMAAALAYLALCRFSRRREFTIRGHALILPSGRLAALQAVAGGANWLLMGVIIWSLFAGRIDYPTALGALLLAAVAGVVTSVPAGLGVLEAVFIATLDGRLPAVEVLAAVLAYRAAYYLVPLALALPAYGLREAATRRDARAAGGSLAAPDSGTSAASAR